MKKLLCPTCKGGTFWRGNPYRPFCSERCKLVDLASWIGEEYSIPGDKTNLRRPGENQKVGP